jgi:hypothetical protein
MKQCSIGTLSVVHSSNLFASVLPVLTTGTVYELLNKDDFVLTWLDPVFLTQEPRVQSHKTSSDIRRRWHGMVKVSCPCACHEFTLGSGGPAPLIRNTDNALEWPGCMLSRKEGSVAPSGYLSTISRLSRPQPTDRAIQAGQSATELGFPCVFTFPCWHSFHQCLILVVGHLMCHVWEHTHERHCGQPHSQDAEIHQSDEFFWDITRRKLVASYRCFGKTHRSHLHMSSRPRRMTWTPWPLKIEPIGCPETPANSNKPTLR